MPHPEVAPAPPPVPAGECLDRGEIARRQGRQLARLLAGIPGRNPFYTRKFDAAGVRLEDLRLPRDLRRLPFTTKQELVADQEAHPPWGTALSVPLEACTRYCQTSSTTGRPLRWVDSAESWQWLVDCWKAVFRAAHVTPADRIFFPFSFGPFLGFWTAFDAGQQIGALCVPGGGMSTQLRLAMIDDVGATVLCCTPTYALRLAEVAAQQGGRPLAEGPVRVIIVGGEPGGSLPSTRARIEQSWGARVIDHHGLTEVGPVTFECWERPGGIHVNEGAYIAEVLDPATGEPLPDGAPGELVLTNLGRTATPVIRYRTGDIVRRRTGPCRCGRTWAWLDGGILTRADDMVVVRGVNVYPTAIESIVRGFGEVAEFRSTVGWEGSMRSLSIEIELAPGVAARAVADRVSREIHDRLGLAVSVTPVDPGALPRFEMKARRFVVHP
jgi:phenylacetate-CoA ligase